MAEKLIVLGDVNARVGADHAAWEEVSERYAIGRLNSNCIVLICRQPDGKLATSVYRKPTNTLQMLSYNSKHPLQHKRSCVRTIYRRVETHCSTPVAKLDEMKLLQELFRANGYPRTFVEWSRKQPRKRNEEPSQPKSWRSIPYMKGVSEALARSLAPLGIGVAHRPDSTIRRQVMLPKDPISKQEMSAVVYRLQCSCGMCNYVGETGRRLQTRMHEHKLAVRRLDPKSEVATHAAQMGHVFNFDTVEIVGRGYTRIRTTAYHMAVNGMVERFHHQLKTSLRAAAVLENWTDHLLLVALGIRPTLKHDLDCSASELVFGATVRLPGEMSSPTPRGAVEDLLSYPGIHSLGLAVVSFALATVVTPWTFTLTPVIC
nr:unnamed protein product [Spirometra erinaceieuropaei]